MDRRQIICCKEKYNRSLFHRDDGIISIGRMGGCHIKFDDFSLSRKQCCIFWDKNYWKLNDGDGAKLSTNGTW